MGSSGQTNFERCPTRIPTAPRVRACFGQMGQEKLVQTLTGTLKNLGKGFQALSYIFFFSYYLRIKKRNSFICPNSGQSHGLYRFELGQLLGNSGQESPQSLEAQRARKTPV